MQWSRAFQAKPLLAFANPNGQAIQLVSTHDGAGTNEYRRGKRSQDPQPGRTTQQRGARDNWREQESFL